MNNALYVDSDNLLGWEGAYDAKTQQFVNSAVVTATLYERVPVTELVKGEATITLERRRIGDYVADRLFQSSDVGKQVLVAGAAQESELQTAIASVEDEFHATLADPSGVDSRSSSLDIVLTAGIPIPYVAGSNGDYLGELPPATKLVDGRIYLLQMVLSAPDGSKTTNRDVYTAQFYSRTTRTLRR